MIGFDLKLSDLSGRDTAFAPLRPAPSPARLADYVTVIGFGLLIGATLGTIAALFLGLIGIC